MNRYRELIYEAREEMVDAGLGRDGNVQVYLAVDVYNELVQNLDYAFITRRAERDASTYTPEASPTPAAEEDIGFDTHDVVEFNGMTLLEDPNMPEGEILVFDPAGIRTGSPFGILIEDPTCIQQIRTKPTPAQEDQVLTCVECGQIDEIAVVGDDGEPYCSIECLNEAYSHA